MEPSQKLKYGVCHLPIIPLRARAEDTAEMVSQVLFGEHFTLIEEQKKWVYIKLLADAYEGWIDRKQYTAISEKAFLSFKESEKVFATDVFTKIASKEYFYVPLGAVFPFYKAKRFYIDTLVFKTSKAVEKKNFDKDFFEKITHQFINAPYLWGGKSIFGVDCSGFTQVVYSLFGVSLLRDARLQATQGVLVPFIEEAKLGDLAFFENSEHKITHVGIMLSNNTIIHAHGKVRIDAIDQEGIYNKGRRAYSHKLRLLKRVL